nr:hypothetical protein Iba_chr11cCG5380 [Ipomoea batatas]
MGVWRNQNPVPVILSMIISLEFGGNDWAGIWFPWPDSDVGRRRGLGLGEYEGKKNGQMFIEINQAWFFTNGFHKSWINTMQIVCNLVTEELKNATLQWGKPSRFSVENTPYHIRNHPTSKRNVTQTIPENWKQTTDNALGIKTEKPAN